MKLLKKINNNFAIGIDMNGEEIIINGCGIGFEKMPCEFTDLKRIERTFYNISIPYRSVIKDIPENVIDITSKLMNLIESQITQNLNPNLFFILADHINFSFTRKKEGIQIDMPIMYDFEQYYPKEMHLGYQALELIKKYTGIKLDKNEAFGIAMNIINAEIEIEEDGEKLNSKKMISEVTDIIAQTLNMDIKRSGFCYLRYETHMYYLILRLREKKQLKKVNDKIYDSMIAAYPKEWKSVYAVNEYFADKMNVCLEKEEMMYIVMHINRLINREDCYQ